MSINWLNDKQNALHPHNRIHSAIKGTIDICYNVGERHKHYAKEVRHTKAMLSNSTYTKYPRKTLIQIKADQCLSVGAEGGD